MDRKDINFEDFCDLMLEKVNEIREQKGVSDIIRLGDITKQNNQIKKAIYLESGGHKIRPVIYMDEVYKKYDGFASCDALAKDLYNLLFENHDTDSNVFSMLTHDGILQNVTYRLINKQMNESFLKDKVYRDYLDLAITYQIVVCVNDNNGYITITKDLVERIGLSEEDLFEMASKNTPRIAPAKDSSLYEVMGNMMSFDDPDDMSDLFRVLSNEKKTYGASVLLYPGLVDKLYEKYGEKYVIPSSLHEVLLVDHNADPSDYLKMVKEVNRTVVDSEEILSDSVYEITSKGLSIAVCAA